MHIALLIGFIVSISANFLLIYMLNKALDAFKDFLDSQMLVNDEDDPSEEELERLARDAEFDERINQIKEELAKQQAGGGIGTVAEELHPLVTNLPHNSINGKREPDIEYAD